MDILKAEIERKRKQFEEIKVFSFVHLLVEIYLLLR